MVQRFLSVINPYNMKPVNFLSRQKKIKSFVLLLSVCLVLFILLLTSLFNESDGNEVKQSATTAVASAPPSVSQTGKLLELDEMLHKRFTRLQQMDQQFAQLLDKNGTASSLDSMNILIKQEEEFVSTVIDNNTISGRQLFTDAITAKQFEQIIEAFRLSMSARISNTSIRNALLDKKAINSIGIEDERIKSALTTEESDHEYALNSNKVNQQEIAHSNTNKKSSKKEKL